MGTKIIPTEYPVPEIEHAIKAKYIYNKSNSAIRLINYKYAWFHCLTIAAHSDDLSYYPRNTG